MATRDLISLVKDAGYAASAGQGFDVNVPNSNANTHMIDYILTDWSWATSDYSSSSSYAYDTVLHFAFSFVSGDHFQYIRRPFSEIAVAVDVPSDPGSYGTVTIVDGGYDYNPWGIPAQHGIAVRIRGALTKRPIASWTESFGYTDGAAEFTDPSYATEMYADFTPTYNSGSSGYHTFPIRFTYPSALFNDGLSYSPGNVTVMGTLGYNSYDIEWYDDSGYTNLVASGTTRVTMADIDNSGTKPDYGIWYIRYREENGSWLTHALHWWDTRSHGSDPN